MDKAKDQPVLIFCGDTDLKKIINDVDKIVDALKVNYGRINKDRAAMEMRATNINRTNGIYVLHRKYARGFDMKLAKDAFVMILSIEKNLPWSVVNQMVGRGCRSFGVADGCYYTCKLP